MASRAALLDALLNREIVGPGVARAAAAAVAVRHRGRWLAAFGAAGFVGGLPTDIDTPFDLASVTKPFLAVLCARLVERGELRWELPLQQLLPMTSGTPGGERTLAEHLSHRAGLQPHVKLFAPIRAGRPIDPEAALHRAATSARPDSEAEDALYSDLGYILAGFGVARFLGEPLDAALLREACAACPPGEIGSSRQLRRRDPRFASRAAPTEHVHWRGGLLRGVVHDDNAWALGGYGSCGHAGLFGSALGLLHFGVALLESAGASPSAAPLLRPESLAELVRPRPLGSLRLGFDSKTGDDSMAGSLAGPNTFGHLGYTGTSLWCDPDADAVTVLLTNRVHPTAENRRIRRARPRVQNELFQLAWKCSVPSRAANAMLPLENPAGLGQ